MARPGAARAAGEIPPLPVDAVSDRLEVIEIHAGAVAAQVIQHEVPGDRPTARQPSSAVRAGGYGAAVYSDLKMTVAITIQRARPDYAPVGKWAGTGGKPAEDRS